MADRLAEIEKRLVVVERRLNSIEGALPDLAAPEEASPAAAIGESFLPRASSLIGRFLLIFGGAFLLRAITDYKFLPTGAGIFLGAAYALFWLYMAFRSGRIDEQRANAVFYGGASVLLALPLLVEATTRFELLSGQQGIFALTLFCALALYVSVSRTLRSLGWLTTGGGIVTAFVVQNTSHAAISPSVFLILLGLGALWAVYLRRWMALQWLGGIGAAAGVAAIAMFSRSEQWSVEPLSAYLLGAALIAVYLASFAIQSHIRGHDVGPFEAVFSLFAIALVFWVAHSAAQADQLALSQVAILSLILGSFAYGLAFTPDTRADRGRNFFFYSTLGLGLVVAGSALLLSGSRAAVVWSIMAVIMAWLSGRYKRVSLSLQCTILLVAAGVGSGILGVGLQALVGTHQGAWPEIATTQLLVAVATVLCLFIPVTQHSERWGALAGLPQLVALTLSVWEVGGLIVAYLAPVLAGVPAPEANLALLAALRTAVLSVASVTLALSSNHVRWPEARWLVYPVLVLVGIKLFVEDFPNGQPVTLFIALAFVGGALMTVSKLLAWKKIEA